LEKTYTYHNPSGSPDNSKSLKVVELLDDDRVLVNINGKEVQTNTEYLS